MTAPNPSDMASIVDARWNALPQELKDAATRASDFVNEAITHYSWDVIKTHYIAIRLSDGSSDQVLYESKREAVKHQMHETQCAYVCLVNLMGGSKPRDMAIFLEWNRAAYKAGMRLPDPDDHRGGKDLLMPTNLADQWTARVYGGPIKHRHPNPFPNGPINGRRR